MMTLTTEVTRTGALEDSLTHFAAHGGRLLLSGVPMFSQNQLDREPHAMTPGLTVCRGCPLRVAECAGKAPHRI